MRRVKDTLLLLQPGRQRTYDRSNIIRYLTDWSRITCHVFHGDASSGGQTRFSVEQSIVLNDQASCPSFSDDRRNSRTVSWIRGRRVVSYKRQEKKKKIVPDKDTSGWRIQWIDVEKFTTTVRAGYASVSFETREIELECSHLHTYTHAYRQRITYPYMHTNGHHIGHIREKNLHSHISLFSTDQRFEVF